MSLKQHFSTNFFYRAGSLSRAWTTTFKSHPYPRFGSLWVSFFFSHSWVAFLPYLQTKVFISQRKKCCSTLGLFQLMLDLRFFKQLYSSSILKTSLWHWSAICGAGCGFFGSYSLSGHISFPYPSHQKQLLPWYLSCFQSLASDQSPLLNIPCLVPIRKSVAL